MSHENNRHRNYLTANETRLRAIAAGAAELLRNPRLCDWRIRLLYDDSEPVSMLVTEPSLDASLDQADGDINIAEAMHDKMRDARFRMAIHTFSVLQPIAIMNYVAKNEGSVDTSPEALEDMYPFDVAEYASAKLEATDYDFIEVTHAEIHGIPRIGSASMAEVILGEEGAKQSTTIYTVGDEIVSCNYKVGVQRDEFVERCVSILDDEDMRSLYGCLGGVFEDEQALHDTLGTIMAKYYATGKEEEVAALLQDIRHRALAAKDAREFNRAFGTDTPPDEHLNRLTRLFSD